MENSIFKKSRSYLYEKKVKRYLNNGDRFKIHCYHSLSSTQDKIKEMAASGAPDGTAVIADTQSAGRGRQGREFFSPSGAGIYMSLLIRPSVSAPGLSPRETTLITALCAVVTAEAIETVTGRRSDIKWVNDVLCDGLKVSGILTEAEFNGGGDGYEYIAVGIGINLFDRGFPKGLRGVACALYEKKPRSALRLKARLVSEILSGFDRRFSIFASGDLSFTEEYKKRSFVIGKSVDMIVGDRTVGRGTAVSLNDDCSLNVKTDAGETQTLRFGEVRIRLNEGQ